MTVARIDIKGDSSQLRRELAVATRDLKLFGGEALAAFTGIQAGALGVAALGVGLVVSARNAINLADEMSKLSQRTGISIQTLSALTHAASLAGASAEELKVGVKKLATSMFDAAHGSAESLSVFRQISVSATDANGALRKTDDVLSDVSDRFSQMPDGATKSAIAVKLFGRAGEKLIPLLNQGRNGLAEMRKEVVRLGLSIDDKTGTSAEAFNDNMTRLQATLGGIGIKIATGMLPALESLSNGLTESASVGDGWLETGELIGAALSFLARSALTVGTAFSEVGKDIGAGAAAAAAALNGQFGLAGKILKERAADHAAATESLKKTLAAFTQEAVQKESVRAKSVEDSTARIIAARNAERQHLIVVLAAQVAAEKDSVKQVADARAKLAQVESENRKFLATLAAGPQKPQDQLLGVDVQAQIAKARAAFKNRDFDAAGAITKEIRENLTAMAKSGQEAGYVLTYLGKQVAAIDAEIAQQSIDSELERAAELRKKIDETLGKAVALNFDLPKSRENLDAVLKDLQKQADDGIAVMVKPVGGGAAAPVAAPGLARGGHVQGPGTGTSDSVLARLSAGEFVVNAAAVQHYGPGLMSAINAMRLPRFSVGGAVGRALSRAPQPVATATTTPLVLDFGDLGKFKASASSDDADAVMRAFSRAALARGRR